MVRAPERIGHEQQRPHALMMPQEEIEHSELLTRASAREIELDEAQTGRPRQIGRVEELRGRVADDGRIELGISRPACRRGMRIPVIDAVDAEPSASAVVGVDQQQHRE